MSRNINFLFSLVGRTALVTGGSRGLGFHIAQALGEAGATVLLTSRQPLALEQATARLREKGIDAQWAVSDLNDEDSVRHLVSQALYALGSIDILVNGVGATWQAPAEDQALRAWDRVNSLNVRSTFLLSQAVGQASMIPLRRGRIINIASVGGLPGNSSGMKSLACSTSKGAVVNFTRALAAEWGPFGITVNALAPGVFETPMDNGIDKLIDQECAGLRTPLRRMGKDEDLKGAAVLFASDAGKYITGQILAVDGGISAAQAG